MAHDKVETSTAPVPPYSAFTPRDKWLIIGLIAFGALLSPLSANIYFPAIPALATAFHKSVELINLTVTLNMVFQGISPMFWGTLSDTFGRRHIFIMCLLVLSLSCIGLALTPTSAYWLLLFLRCFQAAGSASTVALSAGITGDVSTRAERGGFYGLVSIGPMLGPAIGPVLGGVLADKLGWRAIFWFLCIVSTLCMFVMILFLPETLRAIVGNGSIRPPRIYRPVIPIIGRSAAHKSAGAPDSTPQRSKFQNPLRILLHLDIALLLLICAVVYAVFYGVIASISTVFHIAYPHLNETELGLCFLSVGGGMVLGSVLTGRVLDWEYRRILERRHGGGDERDEDQSFPIELARLRLMPALILVFSASCIAYGWCIDLKTSIAAPLVFLILVGIGSIAIMNMIQTLMIDLLPTQGSAVTACNNLTRCATGAALVSGIQPLLDALAPGWAYVLLGGVSALMAPVVYVVLWVGPRCREGRVRRAVDAREF